MFGGYTAIKTEGRSCAGTMSENLDETSGADPDALVCSKTS
jgi:hypothetical protein